MNFYCSIGKKRTLLSLQNNKMIRRPASCMNVRKFMLISKGCSVQKLLNILLLIFSPCSLGQLYNYKEITIPPFITMVAALFNARYHKDELHCWKPDSLLYVHLYTRVKEFSHVSVSVTRSVWRCRLRLLLFLQEEVSRLFSRLTEEQISSAGPVA